MKTRRPPGFETMALDGWIKLGSGETCCLAVDTPTRPSPQELRGKMQGVRGMVLAAGFTIENNMVLVQLDEEFGTTDRKQGGARFMAKEDYLRAESTGVERRLEGAKTILRRVLGAEEGDAVAQDMAEYRRLRHLCAHRPCWLEGVCDPDAGSEGGIPKGRTVGFRLFIADASYIWEVDDEQIAEWAAVLNRTAATGDKVLRSILQIDQLGKSTKPDES